MFLKNRPAAIVESRCNRTTSCRGRKKKKKEVANGARSTFRVSPEALPRDASGFRAWNLPRSIRTKWTSCTLRGITEYRGVWREEEEEERERTGDASYRKAATNCLLGTAACLVECCVVECRVEEDDARVVYCVKH